MKKTKNKKEVTPKAYLTFAIVYLVLGIISTVVGIITIISGYNSAILLLMAAVFLFWQFVKDLRSYKNKKASS